MCEPYVIDEIVLGNIISYYACEYCNDTNCKYWWFFNKKEDKNEGYFN